MFYDQGLNKKQTNKIISAADWLIRLYQLTLSPDHGWVRGLFPSGVCRYQPTCSDYAKEAIKQRGWQGVVLSIRRVARCHPFRAGGHDPVPKVEK